MDFTHCLRNMSKPNIDAELAEARKEYDRGVPFVSSCCSWGVDEGGNKCMKCGENCTSEPEMTFEEWLQEQ